MKSLSKIKSRKRLEDIASGMIRSNSNKIVKNKKKTNHKIQAKNLSKDQRNKAFKSEIRVKKILDELGIKYEWQKPFSDVKRFISVDFYLKDFNSVLEIDGSGHKKRQKYDYNRTLYLKHTHKIKEVYRIRNEQVYSDLYVIKYFLLGLFAESNNTSSCQH